ncbi:MAG: hypothetical protein J1F65_06180 [Clostridiales bacterium]|nr:hypothetical protein [Clostridiales bacterium]
MAFLRAFDNVNISKMNSGDSAYIKNDIELQFSDNNHYLKLNPCYNVALFTLLKDDVTKGNVFPALRNNELHFYYKGGCLFKFVNGAFYRDSKYKGYSAGVEGLTSYEKSKKQNENKFTNKKGEITERQFLDKLYCHTYNPNLKSKTVVLDIEVNLKGNIGWGKKCDLVLLNTETDEIMFVEGKVYSDDRVRSAVGYIPRVIEQVNIYTQAIAEQRQTIIEQYAEYIRIVNELFNTHYKSPRKLIEPAKLLVYKTGGGIAENVRYTIETINKKLGDSSVMWVKDEEPTLDEIWNALSGEICR